MPYISTEEISRKRSELKKEFPNYKFSVSGRHHSTISVIVIEAPIDLRLNSNRVYENVNDFHIKDTYNNKPDVCDILMKIHSIMNEGNRIVSEDGDYGSIPEFYTDLSVGSYEHPFKIVEKKTVIKNTVVKKDVTDSVAINIDNVQIIDYSEKAIAVIGDTKPIKDLLKEMGGRFNFKLTCGPGWIFPMKKKDEIKERLTIEN